MAKNINDSYNDILQQVSSKSGLSQKEFAKRCNQKQSNVAAYLSNNRPHKLGKNALLRCLENYYSWPMVVHKEVVIFDGDVSGFPEVPGIYVFYDSSGNVVYFGKANNLKTEARQTYYRPSSFDVRLGPNLYKQQYRIGDFVKFVSLYEIQNPRIRHNFEVLLLHVFPNQSHNHNLGIFR